MPVEIEHAVQTPVDADQGRYLPNRKECPIYIGSSAAPCIVADCQPLVWHSEYDLGTDHVTRQPNRVNLGCRQGGPSSLPCPHDTFQRNCKLRMAHLGQAASEFPGGAAGCI